MKVAFAIDKNEGLDSPISAHFGKCAYYLYAEIEKDELKSFTVEENPLKDSHGPGELPKYLHEKGVDVIVTGGMGQRARTFFNQYNIEVKIVNGGTVKDYL